MPPSIRHFDPYELSQFRRANLKPPILPSADETPIEYLTHRVEFFGTTLYVDERTLIPRVETETLCQLVLDTLLNNPKQHLHLVDVGCGSGAIGLSIWKAWQNIHRNQKVSSAQAPKLTVTLSDVSSDAVAVATLNQHQLAIPTASNSSPDGARIVQSNLLARKLLFPPDLVVANLPYIPTERIKQLPTSVKHYEPTLALDGGVDGLNLVRQLCQQLSTSYPDTPLWLELDDHHQQQFKPSEYQVEWHADYRGVFRFAYCQPNSKAE